MSERRCPSCGALVAADAEWCGQCLASLREPAAAGSPAASKPPASSSAGTPARRFAVGAGRGRASVWRCPTCDAENGLDADECRVCGTPFGRLFEEAPRPSAVSPAGAAAWSLVLPGLGHWLAGRRADAIARFVLASWIAGVLVVLVGGRFGENGFGSVALLVALFAVAAVALWSEAAVDARRAAAGRAPVVSARAMLWACVALVGLSILLATVLAMPAVRLGDGGG
jgi:hypothetical protein